MTVTPLVFDEAGARYYETGVSKGIFFPIDGSLGVPWNGLVSVSQDVSGGALESSYFDGVKYKDKVLAEEFQATVTAVSTPSEFKRCEGVREYAPGVNTSFNKRDKFHMAWRTEIGNDEGSSVGYKIHVAYNCLVQPTARTYQTLADSPTMDSRAFVITTTPACGRHSYFWFDSREHDLTELEAELYVGNLPACSELSALIDEPIDLCPALITDFENYNPGEFVDDDVLDGLNETIIHGRINNGLDVTDLPAEGAFAANDSAASVVGTSGVLADDDDATYITSADGDLGYTIGLPPLVGYVEGCTFELHIRMSVSGDVNPDDPDNLDADAQVFITTDSGGDLPVGGFSDGEDEGVGFGIDAVDGSIRDYVVPLNMDPWNDLTIDDVVAALAVGAYLNVVGVSNNNPDTTPEVRLYEASVVMLNSTHPEKFLRADPWPTYCSVEHHVYSSGTIDAVQANTVSIDFMAQAIDHDASTDGGFDDVIDSGPLQVKVDVNGGQPRVQFIDVATSTLAFTSGLYLNATKPRWYRVEVYHTWGHYRFRMWIVNEDGTLAALYDNTQDTTITPEAHAVYYGGGIGEASSGKSFDVFLANVSLETKCHESAPVTVDIPATVIDADPGWGSKGSSWYDDSLSIEGNATGIPGHTQAGMAIWGATHHDFTAIGKYGTGPKKFNFDLPTGATILSVHYVVRAYREANYAATTTDADVVAQVATFGAPPSYDYPQCLMQGSGRGSETHYLPVLPVTTFWADAIEALVEETNLNALLVDDHPLDKITCLNDNHLTALVHMDYVAVRVQYQPAP